MTESRYTQFVTVALLAGLVVPVFLGGCMLGPDYERPETPAGVAEGYANQSELWTIEPNTLSAIGPWWERFNDPVTTTLVEQALSENYSLKAAAARVRAAEAVLGQTVGSRMPQVSYQLTRDRSKRLYASPLGGQESLVTTTWNHGINVGYALDLFGRLRRSEEAAERNVLASEANRRALVHVVIAETVRVRVRIATLERQLAIARADTASWRKTVDLVERRYRQGLVDALDLRLAKENLAATEVTDNEVSQLLQLAKHGLDVLLGQAPGRTGSLGDTLAELPSFEPIPVGLPAQLLDRRPDLMRAEMELASATSVVGVRIAQLFPDLTLSANYGFTADHFSDLLLKEGEVYAAVVQLAQPLFRGGQLLAQVDESKAMVEAAAAAYANVVLTAMREVEDALVTERSLRERVTLLQRRLEEAQAAESLARSRYDQGLRTLLAVLETERRRRIAEYTLAATKGQLWSNRVDLFLALGGDWTDEERDSSADTEETDSQMLTSVDED